MSFDSSDLLSEGSQSHVHDDTRNDPPFSFHGYLDEIAGMDSDIDTDTEAEAEEEEEDDCEDNVADHNKNDASEVSHYDDASMQRNESGISYDDSVQQDKTDKTSALNPMTKDKNTEQDEDKLTKCEISADNNELLYDSKGDSISVTNRDIVLNSGNDTDTFVQLEAHGISASMDVEGASGARIDTPPLTVEEPLSNMEPTESKMVHSPPHIKNVASLHDALSPDSAQSPQKNLSPVLPIKKVRMSPLVKTTTFKRPLETPPRMGKSLESQSDSQTSKKPKTISPFSPTARKLRLKQSSGMKQQSQQLELSSRLKWSMGPSRKVSILVNVTPRLDAPLSSNDEESRLCLYPNAAIEESGNVQSSLGYSPARSVRSTYSVASQASILRKACPGQEVILVNPNAFGDVIPTAVTVETARVVQQFSNIASEDWVRKYRFDEVCWPDVKQLIGIKKQNTNATMEDISKATVADVLESKCSVLFGYGIRRSGRLESMFGYIAGEEMDALRVVGDKKNSVGIELGLLGLIVSKLLEEKAAGGKPKLIQLSMVEILDEDVLRDLLQNPSNRPTNLVNKSIRIRHPDNKGAILENVTELNIESMSDVKNAIKKAFHSRHNIKERQMVGGRGHVIATLRVCASADDATNKERKEYNQPMIQLIDLACAETDSMEQEPATGRTKLEVNRILNRRVAGIRKSMAGLGAILRRLVVNEVRDMPQSSMYRSCTLTKMVQRALDNMSSRALMISTVCPRRDSYRRTLHTLNYMHRLLVKPSKTAESPFEGKAYELDGNSVGTFNFFSPGDHSIANSVAYSVASSVASEAIRSEFAHAKGNREFMKSLVTDPRQRLATLLSPKDSPTGITSPGIPMAEITTINEVENDAVDDSSKEPLKDDDDTTSLKAHDSDAIDATVVEKRAADVSQDKLSALSDEITFGDSREELDTTSQDEIAHGEDKDTTFDRVLEQLDEIDTYDEIEDSDYLLSGVESSRENTDSPPIRTEYNALGNGHNPFEVGNMLMESQPSFSGRSDDFSSNHISEQEEERISGHVKPSTETKISRPDPTGVLYDELSNSSPKDSQPSSTFNKTNEVSIGISPSRDLTHDFEDGYTSDQSLVSTLTPYDVTTKEDEAGTNRDDVPSISTEESFPLKPRNQGVAGSTCPHELNRGSSDDQFGEKEQHNDLMREMDPESDSIADQCERIEAEDTIASHSNFGDEKSKDVLKPCIKGVRGEQLASITCIAKNHDSGSGAEISSPYRGNDVSESNSYSTPSVQNSGHFSVNDSEGYTRSSNGYYLRADEDVSENFTSKTVAVDNESKITMDKNLLHDFDQNMENDKCYSLSTNSNDYRHYDGYTLHPTIEHDDVADDVVAKRSDINLETESTCRNVEKSASITDQDHVEKQFKSLSFDDDDVGGEHCDGDDDQTSSLGSNDSIDRRSKSIVNDTHRSISALLIDDSNVEEANDIRLTDETGSYHDGMKGRGLNDGVIYTDQGHYNDKSEALSGDGGGSDCLIEGHELASNSKTLQFEFHFHSRSADISEMREISLKKAEDSSVVGSDHNKNEPECFSVSDKTEEPASSYAAKEGSVVHESDNVSLTFLDFRKTKVRNYDYDGVPGMDHEEDECESLSSLDDEDIRVDKTIPGRQMVENDSNIGHEMLEALSLKESVWKPEDHVDNSGISDNENDCDSLSSEDDRDDANMVNENFKNQSASDFRDKMNAIKAQNICQSEHHGEDKRKGVIQESDEVPSAHLRATDKSHSQRVTAMYQNDEQSKSLSNEGVLNCSSKICTSETTDKIMQCSAIERSGCSKDGEVESHDDDSVLINVSSKHRTSVSQMKIAPEVGTMYSRLVKSQSAIIGEDGYPDDQYSSDGESLEIEPSSSSADFTKDVAILRSVCSVDDSFHDIALIQLEVDRLERSLKRCVDSTQESELLKELATDKLDITSPFNPNEKPLIRTIKELASQADALQSFIKSRFSEGKRARESEEDSEYDVLETSANVDEALNEIRSLKLSTLASLDQIKKDHMDALNENVKLFEKGEEGREKSSKVKSSEGSILGTSRNIKQPSSSNEVSHERLDTERCDECRQAIEHETDIESNIALPSHIATLLSKDKDALSEVLLQFSAFRSGLDEGREYTVSDVLKQFHRLEKKLYSHLKYTDDVMINIKKIDNKSTETNAGQTDDAVQNLLALYGQVATDEKGKDELEDRLTDEINKLQSLLDDKGRTIDDLRDAVSKYEGIINCSTDNENKLREEIRLLQNLVKTVSAFAEDVQSSSSEQMSKLKEEIVERSKTVETLRQNLESTKKEYEDRLVLEKRKSLSLEDTLSCLQNDLGAERRENNQAKLKWHDKTSRLEKELIAFKNEADASKRSYDMTLSEYDVKLENEAIEKRRLIDKCNAVQNDLERLEQEKITETDNLKKQLEVLQNELEERNSEHVELTEKIQNESFQYEGKILAQENLIKELEQKINEVEDRFSEKSTQYCKIESKYKQMLQNLEKDILVKTETNHALEETITSLKRDYENRMKFDAVEKAAMEEDISTLQQRLREETQERDDVEYRLSSRLETLTDELRELKLKNSELRQSLDDLCHQHESTVNKLQSEKKSKAVIEEQVVELERRLAEEVKYRDEISNQFENKLRTSNQELRDKVSIIESLSLEINKAREEIKVANCRIASELDQNNIMANELSALENRLADEVEKYATYKEQNTRYVKDMQACIEEEKQINSKLSNEIHTLKMEHEIIQGKLAASVTQRMKEKASLEAQTSCLETELEELSEKNDVLKKTVQDLTQENESLKDRVQAECQKLTAELTERMKEKAFYDNEVAKLSSIIEKTTQECSHLQEEILECKAALSASEDHLASSINEKCSQEEIFMNRIAYFENALKDCCSSKKELEDNIQALQSEKEELIRFNDELNLLRESSEGEKQFLLKERDDLIAKNTEINIRLQKVEVELSDLTSLHAEVEQNHSETLKSLDELKIEKEIATKQFHADAVEWETKMNELAAKLAKEVDERIKEKTLYTNEISKISSEASAEREKYLHAMTSSEGKYLKLKEDFEAEKEKYANLKEESSVKISSLKDILEEKEQLSKQLQELLDTARQDVCALNDTIQNSSNQHSEEVRIHTEKIYKLESIIKEKKLQLVAENENAEKLRAEISVLNESLREETEKNATREQLHLEEVEKLKSMISKNNGEFERLKQHLSNQTREIEDITEKLAQEISSKKQLQKEAEEVQNIRSTLKELEETLSIVMKEKDSETEKKEQAISEANHFKVQMEHENENLRRNYDTEVEKVKNISQQLRNIQSSIKDKDDSIQELETTIFELRDSLEKETTKVYMLEKTQESKDRENADLLREIQSLMDRVSQESLSTTSKIEKLEQSLKSKAAENEELGDLVNKLRQEKDEIKRSMEQELDDSKENLSKSFQQTINDLQYRIQELENEKRSNNDITDKKLEDLSERISELSIIKEALQDENALLKEKIMEEKSSREQIDRKNKALKTALYENERQIREEMRELESTMHMTISKIETKRKKAVEEERNKLSSTLDKLESENDVYKIKIVQLESTIRHLESRLSVEQSLQGNGDNAIGDNSSLDYLKRENDELRSQLHLLQQQQQQQQQQQHSPPKDRSSSSTPNRHQGRNHSDDTTHSHYYSMEYHLEKERRIKAEEFAAAMAARAKAGFEERNQEILALRVKVSTLESEKEIFRKQQTLLLEGDTLQNQTALSRPAALTLAIQQRDEALEEAKRYRSIAKKLNSHVQYLNQWVDNSADDNRGRIKASFGAGNNVIIGDDDSSTLSSKKVGNDLNSSHGFGV